jgi:hypothetical protein
MKRRRHTPEQIVRKLREADRLLAEGLEVPELAKHLEISEATEPSWDADPGRFNSYLPPRSSGHEYDRRPDLSLFRATRGLLVAGRPPTVLL